MTFAQRPTAKEAVPQFTPARPMSTAGSVNVAMFKMLLQKAALETLDANEARIQERQKQLKDTAPGNPAWSALHRMAEVNSHLDSSWNALSRSILDEVTARSGHPAPPVQPGMRLSNMRDSLIQDVYLTWSRTHPDPEAPQSPTQASNKQYLSQFANEVALLNSNFEAIQRVEDAKDYLYAQYPELAVLSREVGLTKLAQTPNTKVGNASLDAHLNDNFAEVKAAIAKLRGQIKAGKLPLKHMDVLIQQVLERENITLKQQNPVANKRSQEVLAWLMKEQAENAWVDLGLILTTLGFTLGALLAPEFVLPLSGALAAGATLTTRNYLKSQEGLTAARAGDLGGQALSSQSVEQAKFAVVMAQLDALLVAGGAAGVIASGVSKIAPLTKSIQAAAESGAYRWQAGAIRTGPLITDVRTPEAQAAFRLLEVQRAEKGLPPFAMDNTAPRSTVAVVEVNGRKFYGVNSRVDISARPMRRDTLTSAQQQGLVKEKANIGTAQAFTHAEGHALMQAQQEFKVFPPEVTLYVDRTTCNFCTGKEGLQALADLFKIRKLVVIDAKGRTWVFEGEF